MKKNHAIILLTTGLLSIWGIYFCLLFSRMVDLRPDGLYFGHPVTWSDWALHVAMISIFAFKDPAYWFAYHPIYADGKMTYPFLTNLFSGLLVRSGISLEASLIFPSVVFALLLVGGAYLLFRLLLRNQGQAVAAVFIFFLSSGLGFIRFIQDFLTAPSLGLFLYPPREYSRFENYQWYSGNFITGHLLPQRAFLLGMAMVVWILYGVLYSFTEKGLSLRTRKLSLLSCGVAAGILPIAHMHSFIALVVFSAAILLPRIIRRDPMILYYGVPAGVISSLLYRIFIFGGIQVDHFMKWDLGFGISSLREWLTFWWSAWGIAIPLAGTGLWILWRKKERAEVQGFFWAALILFAMGNLFIFQPIRWDNSKLFLWTYLGFSGLSALSLGTLWNKRFHLALAKPLCGVLFVTLGFTGFLEVTRLQRIDRNTYRLLSQEEIDVATAIREKTGQLARFLTAPTHDHPVMVWGARPILLGYSAWAMNYGFKYTKTESDLPQLFKGGREGERLLKLHRISYVYVGTREVQQFHPNEKWYASHFPVAFSGPGIRVYDVRKLGSL